MRVYISADIEGITGLVSWSQCGGPNSSTYDFDFARRMMTHDVNAAIRGARAAGASLIVVKDSHGNSKNLLVDELEPGVELISGWGGGIDGMMVGLDGSFDACMLVGYHAMAGTLGGVMEHTITGGVHRLWVNDRESGEIGLSAGVAGRFGVPLVLVSSDEAGCSEASGLVPGVATAVTKYGLSRFMGRVLTPEVTGQRIAEAARSGLTGMRVQPFVWDEPTRIRVEFNRSEQASTCERLLGIRRVDGYSVAGEYPTYEEAHRLVWSLMTHSGAGLDSQN